MPTRANIIDYLGGWGDNYNISSHIMNNAAVAYSRARAGQLESAKRLADVVKQAVPLIDSPFPKAFSLCFLSAAYSELDDNSAASELLKSAEAAVEKTKNTKDYPIYLSFLSIARAAHGDRRGALDIMNEAVLEAGRRDRAENVALTSAISAYVSAYVGATNRAKAYIHKYNLREKLGRKKVFESISQSFVRSSKLMIRDKSIAKNERTYIDNVFDEKTRSRKELGLSLLSIEYAESYHKIEN